LFGHEKGAFTGALTQKIGRFEVADGGTLFLDEVGEIPLDLQPKLLRAIQEQEFERLGSNRTIRVNVRLIAATNRDLKTMMEDGKFRSDLYYRLNVFPIHVPPLRDRKEDIPLLVSYFTQKYAQRIGRQIDSIPSSALQALMRYDWPGNIRVLQLAMPEGGPVAVRAPRTPGAEAAERERILRALRQTNGVVGGPRGAAALLGMKRTTLQSRMKRLGIRREYR
jgi:formate hydrogenlyase transcriptional activator